MSNDSGLSIWVGDLDGYISIDAIDRWHRKEFEEEARDMEFASIGDIALLDGKVIRSASLRAKKLEPSEWRWAIHEAESVFGVAVKDLGVDQQLVRTLVGLGRAYSIGRYAKWEKLSYASAVIASMPLGLKALLSQYLVAQGLDKAPDYRMRVADVLKSASTARGEVAYSRASRIQKLIHSLAHDTHGSDGPASLHRDATRIMLSLARLHYSVVELSLSSFADVVRLRSTYARARSQLIAKDDGRSTSRRYILGWPFRHVRPLTDLLPFSVRYALARGVDHVAAGLDVSRSIAINEVALAHCGMLMMRRSRKGVKGA